MLILFDHGTPRGISRALQGHIVKEARAQGWDTLSNGDLLKAAEEAGRDSQQKQVEPGASHDATDCQSSERRKTWNLHSG